MSRYGGSSACPIIDNSVISLIFIGESNVAAVCPNTDLPGGDLGVHPEVQILNNTNLVIENLDVGLTGNNLIGHDGISGQAYHGWEVQLCRQVVRGDWGTSPAYLLKSGQGGSQIASWTTGGSYYLTFAARWAAFASGLSSLGKTANPAIWVSLGLNDEVAGTDAETWKSGMISWFANMRSTIGFPNAPIILTNFGPVHDNLNVKIAEIAELPNNYMVDTTSLALQGDNLHWTTAATASLADLFAAVTIPIL